MYKVGNHHINNDVIKRNNLRVLAMNDNNPSFTTAQPVQSNANGKKTFDFKATINYIAATTLQWNLIRLTLTFIDQKLLPCLTQFDIFLYISNIVSKYFKHFEAPLSFLPKFEIYPRASDITSIVVIGIMFFLSLRSRIFSPLDNSRPKATGDDPVFRDRKRPSWQPPALAFPIIWSTISILRTISSYLIYKATGSLVSTPLLFFFAHLSIGDTWNTINNVEKRLGTAAFGVLFVLASVYLTTYEYYKTFPLAGYILAPSCVWLSIATILVFTIWKINYDSAGKPSFYPSIQEGPISNWRIPFLKK